MGKIMQTPLRYDGEYLKDHNIDISVLAPSLIGLSNLIQETNSLFNGDKTKINLKVNAGIEQNCFEILLVFDFNAIDQMLNIFKDDAQQGIKGMLEIIGIVASGSGQVQPSLFQLIKIHGGKPILNGDIISADGENTIIKGDKNQNITVNNNVITIYNNSTIQGHTQNFMKPLLNDGLEEIQFGDSSPLHKKDYTDYLNTDMDQYDAMEDTETNVTTKNLVVHKPELSQDAKIWQFSYDGKAIQVDISSTRIARDTIKRGDVRVGDTYKVKLEEQEYKTPKGQYKTRYKILEVLKFTRGLKQEGLDV